MRITNHIPSKARKLERMLQAIARLPAETYFALLKMAKETGYFSDNLILTQLSATDKLLINEINRRADTRHSKVYRAAPEVTPMLMLPRSLGPEIETASYAGVGTNFMLALLKGGGLEQLVEVRSFQTVLKRHPNASWYFASGKDYYKKAVVLIEPGGLFSDELLGALTPLEIKDGVDFAINDKTANIITRTLKIEDDRYFYVKGD